MLQKILDATDPKLRQKSKNVGKIDKKVLLLIKGLKDTLSVQKDPEGVGLAAPQIGKNLRLFIVKYGKLNQVFINPEIVTISKTVAKTKRGKTRTIMEGCLSLPNYYGPLKRAQKVVVKFTDEDGRGRLSEYNDFYAQIILHEMDHLNGILFVDRLLEQKKPLYKLDGNEWEEVELV